MDPQTHIEALAADLEPTRRWSGRRALAIWAGFSLASALGLTLATGPLRAGLVADFTGSAAFVLESALGAAAVLLALWAGLRLAVPGAGRTKPLAGLVALAVGLWAAWYGAMLADLLPPALAPSMQGKRDGCVFQALLFALPSLALGLGLAARRMPLAPTLTGAVVGFAAGGFPAWLMQLACMYEPRHILLFHLGPAFLLAAVGAIAGRLSFPRL